MLLLAGMGGWWYLRSRFPDFKGAFEERTNFPEITAGGYTFRAGVSSRDIRATAEAGLLAENLGVSA